MDKTYHIVGIGEALWDMFPEGKKLGGAPANFAYHASQLGFNAITVSAIGNDVLGGAILENLAQKKLRHAIAQVEYPTGTVVVTLDEKGIPQYEISTNVAWDNIPFTDELASIARNTHCVCFGSLAQRNVISRQTIHQFIGLMPKDSLRVFDINLRQHFYSQEVIRESLRICNILKINDQEAAIMAQLFPYHTLDINEVCKRLKDEYSLDLVILTCGESGSHIFYDESVSHLATPHVAVADTVGAGDSFTAGFCCARLAGRSIPEAHSLAVELSAYVCTQSGAMPEVPANIISQMD